MAIWLPRTLRISRSDKASRLRPSSSTSPNSMRPGGCGMSRISDMAVTLLPEPDSPTSARVCPASTEKDTLSTAVKGPRSV